MRAVLLLFLAGGLLLVSPSLSCGADVYVHVDSEGLPHYTDAPTKPYYRRVLAFGLPPGADLARGPYAELINASAREQGVDPGLVRAIIRAESNFNQRAVSRKGAQGLMQLMPDTAFRYAVRDPFDPADNIRGGVQYLRFLHDTFPGQLSLVVAAYNAGENAVLRHGGIPPYRETREYVTRVLRSYRGNDRIAVPSPAPRKTEVRPGQPPAAASLYRREAPDGSVSYSNVPPLTRGERSPAAP
jgi:soluble lytic murein transglycosylase